MRDFFSRNVGFGILMLYMFWFRSLYCRYGKPGQEQGSISRTLSWTLIDNLPVISQNYYQRRDYLVFTNSHFKKTIEIQSKFHTKIMIRLLSPLFRCFSLFIFSQLNYSILFSSYAEREKRNLDWQITSVKIQEENLNWEFKLINLFYSSVNNSWKAKYFT